MTQRNLSYMFHLCSSMLDEQQARFADPLHSRSSPSPLRRLDSRKAGGVHRSSSFLAMRAPGLPRRRHFERECVQALSARRCGRFPSGVGCSPRQAEAAAHSAGTPRSPVRKWRRRPASGSSTSAAVKLRPGPLLARSPCPGLRARRLQTRGGGTSRATINFLNIVNFHRAGSGRQWHLSGSQASSTSEAAASWLNTALGWLVRLFAHSAASASCSSPSLCWRLHISA
jgi:hypothetical protein